LPYLTRTVKTHVYKTGSSVNLKIPQLKTYNEPVAYSSHPQNLFPLESCQTAGTVSYFCILKYIHEINFKINTSSLSQSFWTFYTCCPI